MRTALLLALFAGLGCNTPTTTASQGAEVPGALERSGETLATVNGQPVTRSMLDATLRSMPDEVKAQLEASGQVEGLVEQIVTQEVLYQEAIAQKMHEDEVVQIRLTLAARDALIESLLRKVVEEQTNEEAIKAWYVDHMVQFRKEQARISHIVVKEEADAQAAFAEASAEGADFAAVAKARSIDPAAAQNGGELGWLGKQELAGPLGEAAFGAEAGQVVGPIQSPFGWHIVKVHEKRDMIPLEDVKDDILPQVQQEVASKYVEELRAAATAAEGAEGAAAGGEAGGAGDQ